MENIIYGLSISLTCFLFSISNVFILKLITPKLRKLQSQSQCPAIIWIVWGTIWLITHLVLTIIMCLALALIDNTLWIVLNSLLFVADVGVVIYFMCVMGAYIDYLSRMSFGTNNAMAFSPNPNQMNNPSVQPVYSPSVQATNNQQPQA